MPKWVNQGENRVANVLFGSTSPDTNYYLGIYTNSTEPAEDATLPGGGNPITELSGNGYARKTLARGSWDITDDLASFAQQMFQASGGAWSNCYGYFICNSSDNTGQLLCVEHFAGGPYNVPDSKSIKITPRITVA